MSDSPNTMDALNDSEREDPALATMLDGNAAAGALYDIFGADVTALPSQCANCGNVAEVGTMLAWMRGPGIVLRCSTCQNVVMRIVETPTARYIDAHGVAYLRLPK